MSEAKNFETGAGLPERGQLWGLLYDSFKHIRRDNTHSGILLIEINDLDDVEGILGDHGLESYLNIISERIEKCLWDLDAAVRFEHNKFVIIANSIHKQPDIHVVLEKTKNYLEIDLEIDGRKIEPSTTIGIVLIPEDATEADEVMNAAQTAVKMAKVANKEYCYYNEELGIRIAEQEDIKKSILETLAKESFLLMLQPKINTESRKVCGVEALVRMRDSDGNIVAPGEFIPVAENSNLILEIGDWVLHSAQQLSQELQQEDINIPISINISDVQFKNSASLLSTLHKLSHENEESAENLILEISENTITNDIALASALMSEIKSFGYQISIDGFGAGFSSLSVMKDLSIDEIKVDRHFLSDVPKDDKNTAILNSIIMLGKAMGFRVVAMGVENEGQFALLKEHNCDELQGFHISEPMEASDYINWHKSYSS